MIGQFGNPSSFKATGSRTSFCVPFGPITGQPLSSSNHPGQHTYI